MKRRLDRPSHYREPEAIIVDEPTTGLDPEERIRFRNILSDISDSDSIIILSTHIGVIFQVICKKLGLVEPRTEV